MCLVIWRTLAQMSMELKDKMRGCLHEWECNVPTMVLFCSVLFMVRTFWKPNFQNGCFKLGRFINTIFYFLYKNDLGSRGHFEIRTFYHLKSEHFTIWNPTFEMFGFRTVGIGAPTIFHYLKSFFSVIQL